MVITMKIGFIGAGNMGGALALAAARKFAPTDVCIYDVNAGRCKELEESLGCTVLSSEQEIIEQTDIVMLCVKPQAMAELLDSMMPAFSRRAKTGKKQLVCSIAAGYDLAALTGAFQQAGLEMPILRMLPNIPVSAGQGLLLISNNAYASQEDVDTLKDAMEGGGMCEHVTEDMLTTACPVFSCSPAFVYMFIESIADSGVQNGMTREEATRFAAQGVLGSAALVLEGKKHIGQLKDELSTPGGMTIAGTNVMERMGFRGAVIEGINKCYERQNQLA